MCDNDWFYWKYTRRLKYGLYRWQFDSGSYLKFIYLAEINTSCLVDWISFVFLSSDAIIPSGKITHFYIYKKKKRNHKLVIGIYFLPHGWCIVTVEHRVTEQRSIWHKVRDAQRRSLSFGIFYSFLFS